MAKSTPINPKLEAAIDDMLDNLTAVADDGAPKFGLLDKCRIIDRALTLEKIKKGMQNGAAGSAFFDDDDEEPGDLPEQPDPEAPPAPENFADE